MPQPAQTTLPGEPVTIAFDFTTGSNFAQASRELDPPADAWGEILFRASGVPNDNRLEVKIEDDAGRIYGKHVSLQGTNFPRACSVRADEARHWAGPPGQPGRIRQIHFILANSGRGGRGEVTFDQLAVRSSRLFINISQIGFAPGDAKRFIVRGLVPPETAPAALAYVVSDAATQQPVRQGRMERAAFSDWSGVYWTADISDLREPGRYVVTAYADPDAPGCSPARSAPFAIGDHPLSEATAASQFNYFRAMRWDPARHGSDAIAGGYYDTAYDTCKRPWSLTHVLRAFARYARFGSVQTDEAMEELRYLTPFSVDLLQEDGAVSWVGLNEFTRRRATDKSLLATCYNIVGLLEAHAALADADPALAARAAGAARKSWEWVGRQQLVRSADIGAALWACLKLYETTAEPAFAARAQGLLPRLLIAQALDPDLAPDGIRGVFWNAWRERSLSNGYKYFVHGQGAVQLALLDYCRIFEPDAPGWRDAYRANAVFCDDYLAKTARRSPYGIVSLWFEPRGDRFGLMYGPKFIPADPVYHALNSDYAGFAELLAGWARLSGQARFADAARDQLQWIAGQNPLGLSMITGVGERYAPVFSEFWNHGANIRGCIPNGIMFDERGQPTYMAETYLSGEDWLPNNAYWLLALVELEGAATTAKIVPDDSDLAPPGGETARAPLAGPTAIAWESGSAGEPIRLQTPRGNLQCHLTWDAYGLHLRATVENAAEGASLIVEAAPAPHEFIEGNAEYVSRSVALTPDASAMVTVRWDDLHLAPAAGLAIGLNVSLLAGPDRFDWHRKPAPQDAHEIGQVVLLSPLTVLETSGRVTASSCQGGSAVPSQAWGEAGSGSWRPEPSDRSPWMQLDLAEPRALTGVCLWSEDPGTARLATSADGATWSAPVAVTLAARREITAALPASGAVRSLRIATDGSPAISKVRLFARDYAVFFPAYPLDVKAATSSGAESAEFGPEKAFDGRMDTRFSSAFADGHWLQADLGETCRVSKVQLAWERAYAQDYGVELSLDGQSWARAYAATNAPGGEEIARLVVPIPARYVRVVFDRRATTFGASLWEAVIYGERVDAP